MNLLPVTDEDVEAVEAAVGFGHGAWDTVDPKEIIRAAQQVLVKQLQDEHE